MAYASFDPNYNTALEGRLPVPYKAPTPPPSTPGTAMQPLGNGYNPNFTLGENYVKSNSKALTTTPPPAQSSFTADDLARGQAYQQRTRFDAPPASKPAPDFVNDTTKGFKGFLGDTLKNLNGSMATATGIASQVINNPMIANQINEGLARHGMDALVPSNNTMSPEVKDKLVAKEAPNIDFSNPSIDTTVYGGLGQPGQKLTNGAIAGNESPHIDFSNPSVNTSTKADTKDPRNDYINQQMLVENNAMSRGPEGLTRYTQGLNGELLRQGSSGEISTMAGPPKRNRQSPAAEAAGTTDAWYNNGYPGGPAQYRQESEMKKQQAALYQTLGNLQQDAMNPMLSREARANAAQMHGQLVQHINGLGQQQVSREGNQNQHDYQLGQLGNQQRQQNFTEQQYADQAPDRQYKNQITGVQQTALGQGPEADKAKSTLSALGLTNQKERFHGIALDNPSDPNGFKTGQRLGGIDIYSGQITDPGQQSEKQNDYAQLQQAIKLYPDRAKEFQDRFNQKYAVQ